MISRIHFHCITTWVAPSFGLNSAMHLLILWFQFTRQMELLSNINFYFDCNTRLCFIISGREEEIFIAQESFYLQGILDDINEQDTSFFDCKHKHMIKLKTGAPPDKVGVLYRMFTYRIPWFHKQN